MLGNNPVTILIWKILTSAPPGEFWNSIFTNNSQQCQIIVTENT